jgi:hypothetical protein
MISKKLELLKKNRVYFKCKTESGYEVKLKITAQSENLDLGWHQLLVNDVSVVTKYGKDTIFEVFAEQSKTGRITTLQHYLYNTNLVNSCKELGGKWDADSKAWVFDEIVENEVEALDELYNSDIVTVEISAVGERFAQPSVMFCGYVLASASGRDSGAKLGNGIVQISGEIGSGGSMKNWGATVADGTIFRLKIGKKLVEHFLANAGEQPKWSIKFI